MAVTDEDWDATDSNIFVGVSLTPNVSSAFTVGTVDLSTSFLANTSTGPPTTYDEEDDDMGITTAKNDHLSTGTGSQEPRRGFFAEVARTVENVAKKIVKGFNRFFQSLFGR